MYRKREREFQYPPGIEKIIEDVIGGGTIDRRDLQNALFNGKALDELPPIVIVVKDPETGLFHVLKTATVSEAAAADATVYKVAKNHLFGVGDFVTVGGALTGASYKITAIDKSNAVFFHICSPLCKILQIKNKLPLPSGEGRSIKQGNELQSFLYLLDCTLLCRQANLSD